jgi:hypothetical protein
LPPVATTGLQKGSIDIGSGVGAESTDGPQRSTASDARATGRSRTIV